MKGTSLIARVTTLIPLQKSSRLLVNVPTYVILVTAEPVKAYYRSALHLGDDFQIQLEHRLSPRIDSL